MNFKELCSKAAINYNTAISYKRRHPELSDEQIILRYNPYCYYNILGDFIPVPLPSNMPSESDIKALSDMLDYLMN